MNQTIIIVPTYNEQENLPRMAAKLLSLPVGVDLLVVDDNSPDGTGRIADELAAQHPQAGPGPRLPRRVQMGAGKRLRIHL
jgi:dolichol-phosphate mannosyltransferase